MKNILKALRHKINEPTARIAVNSNVSLDTKLDKYVKILPRCKIGKCKIGRYTYIGNDCDFARTEIGAFTSIGPQVICGMGSHPLDFISTYPGFYKKEASGSEWLGNLIEFKDQKETIIGSDVWIGVRAIIVAGINIGHGSVIAAGSVVTKDVPPYAIVAGVPARVVRYRFSQDEINLFLKSKWWDFPIESIKNSAKYCHEPNEFIADLKVVN